MDLDRQWCTERLVIRPFREADLADFHELHGDPEAMRFLRGPWSIEKSRQTLGLIVGNYPSREMEWLAVADRATGTVMGACWIAPLGQRWHPFIDGGPHIELGYRYARRHWGKGIATEAGRAMLRRGFTEMNLPRIVSIVDAQNIASERVLQKLGMRYERTFPYENIQVRFYTLDRQSYMDATGPA